MFKTSFLPFFLSFLLSFFFIFLTFTFLFFFLPTFLTVFIFTSFYCFSFLENCFIFFFVLRFLLFNNKIHLFFNQFHVCLSTAIRSNGSISNIRNRFSVNIICSISSIGCVLCSRSSYCMTSVATFFFYFVCFAAFGLAFCLQSSSCYDNSRVTLYRPQ